MASEWPVVRLGDYVDSSLGKMLDAKKNKGELHPYLGNSNVRWGQFDLSNLAEMRFEEHEQERYQLLPGDLVVCEGGEPGRCAIWRGQIPGMKIQKALHRVRAKPGLKNEYLYYWLTLAARLGTLEPYFTGTTIKHLTGRALADLELPLPPITVQESIVSTLGVIDERIDCLRQINHTLEAIAQALFKSWFVDFDPVRAKAEGREPEGMDAATAALFPDTFDSQKALPHGWCWAQLGKVFEVGIGKTPPRKEAQWFSRSVEDVAWVSIRDMGEAGVFLMSTAEKLTPEAVSRFNVRTVPAGTVLMSFKLTVGRVAIADKDLTTNEAIAHFNSMPESLPQTYLYCYLKSYDMDSISSTSSIATATNSKAIRDLAIPHPGDSLADAFHDAVAPLFERIRIQQQQASTLSEIRDTLLPRLISGKLRLPDVERDIEAATA